MSIRARLSFVFLMLCCSCLQHAAAADESLFSRPEGRVLDKADVLLPETITALNDAFLKAEQEHSLHVYLITIPFLKDSGLDQKGKLEETANLYAQEWIQGVGAVIIYNDENAFVSVAYSTEAKHLYQETAIDALLKGPLDASQKFKGLQRDKIMRAAKAVLDVMSKIQEETTLKSPRQHPLLKFLAAFLLLLAVVLIMLDSMHRKPTINDEPAPKKIRRRKKHSKW